MTRPDAVILALDQGTTGSTALRLRTRRRGARARVRRDPAALPAAGLGRARRRGDLAEEPPRAGRGRWRPRASRRARSARSGSPTSARRRCSGTGAPATPVRRRDRVAEPPDGARLRAAARGGARAALPRAHRPRARPVLLRHARSRGCSRATRRCGPAPRRARSPSARSTRWLIRRLTGGRVHATDPTNASRTLLYDIHERRLGPGAAASSSASRRPCCPRCARAPRSSARRRPRGRAGRDPDRGRRGRPAGGALRPGLLRGRAWPRTPTAPAASWC